MTRLYFDGELKLSCGGLAFIQAASVIVSEDYTMNEVVRSIKEAGYASFKLTTMKKLVRLEG